MVTQLSTRYADIADQLRSAYDGSAAERDAGIKEDWKLAERQSFLQLLRKEGRTSLLEVGAGTGQDSLYFKEHGASVAATATTMPRAPAQLPSREVRTWLIHCSDRMNRAAEATYV